MVTAQEVAAIALFAELDGRLHEQAAHAAADITLQAGEFAVQQGEERALFGVLEGRLQAVMTRDGVERLLNERNPGDIFGEVPITLGTAFPVGFRALEPSRVLRLEARDYHALAAAAPGLSAAVGALAFDRMTGTAGLQALAAAPPPPRAIVVGHRLDTRCTELRRFLDRNQIAYDWLEPGSADAERTWGGPLPPDADCPTIRVIGGKTVVHPHHRRVAELLEIPTDPAHAEYDVVVAGAGPAGLAAAVYAASEGLSTLVIEREAPGGQAGTSSRIENYLGFPAGVSGAELSGRALEQARRLGAEIIVTRAITRIDIDQRKVHLDDGDVVGARTIILACGVSWRRLDIKGFDWLSGKGIFYGAARSEAKNVHGLDIHIVGGGNSAGQAALSFSTYASSVTILYRGDSLERSMSRYLIEQLAARSNIHVRTHTQVNAALGGDALVALELRDGESGTTETVPSGGLFLFIGADAETGWLPTEIARDAKGFVLTGPDVRTSGRWALDRDPYLLETSVPGVFACGDVRLGPVKRVAAAVGEGSMAIAFVHQFLRETAPGTARS